MKIDLSHVKDGKFVDPADVVCELLKEQRAMIDKGHTKNRKKVDKALIKKRECHIRRHGDVRYRNIKYKIKKNDLQNEKYFGLGALYNIITDPDLGVGMAALRKIPCVCVSCRDTRRRNGSVEQIQLINHDP